MGGILVDGCGASDSYYKLKDVAVAHCKTCNADRMFALMQLKMKIRVFWVPTVSIDTKYAVVCPVCKNGYIVNEAQKNDILAGRTLVHVQDDGLELLSLQAEVKPNPTVIEAVKPDRPRFCFRCGSPLDSDGHCPNCDGTPKRNEQVETAKSSSDPILSQADTEKKPLLIRPQTKICPNCQLLYAEDKTVCELCGRTLVHREKQKENLI